MSRTRKSQLFSDPTLKVPEHLSEGATLIFKGVANSVADGHFSGVDSPLLEQYAVACDLARQAQHQLDLNGAIVGGKPNSWLAVQEKSVRAMVALSARLRICPQSRFDRLKAGLTSRPQYKSWAEDPDGLLAAPVDPYAEFADKDPNPFVSNGKPPKKPKHGLASFR